MSSNPPPGYFNHMGESSDDEDYGEDQYRVMLEEENVINYDMGMSQAPYASGLVRATYQGNDTEATAYHNEGECVATVKKLIWADGWHSGEQSQRMTLVMLKLRFDPQDGAKVTYASLKLRLKSMLSGDEDPQLVAWAPFHTPQAYNAVAVHKEESNLRGMGMELGVNSQKGTAKWEKTKAASWDETDTELGRSTPKFSEKRKNPGEPGQPNGVLWQVQQNQTLDRGITPEFHVAALFNRPTSGNYKASFRITAYTSKSGQAMGRCLRLIGQPGGDKVKWLVSESPGSKQRCFGDGKQLIDSIDLDNLNNLRERPDSEHFNQEWREMLSMGNFEPAVQKAKAKAAAAHELRTQTEAKDNISQLPEQGHRDDARASGKAAAPPSAPPNSVVRAVYPEETPPQVQIPVDRSAKAATSTSAAAESPSAATETLSLQDNKATTLPSLALMPETSYTAAAGRKTPPTASVLSYDGTSRMVALEDRMGRQDGRVARLEERVAELERTLLRMTEALVRRPQPQL
jgi:hypothetical protein